MRRHLRKYTPKRDVITFGMVSEYNPQQLHTHNSAQLVTDQRIEVLWAGPLLFLNTEIAMPKGSVFTDDEKNNLFKDKIIFY